MPVRFVADSLLEGTGFELALPPRREGLNCALGAANYSSLLTNEALMTEVNCRRLPMTLRNAND